MKAILISINGKHVDNILSGKKIAEIRKTIPNCELPIDVYIYCTKQDANYYIKNKIYNSMINGKVVAMFRFESYLKGKLIDDEKFDNFFYDDYQLTRQELKDYVGNDVFYEWHIKNLEIFDKPKDLKDFLVVSHTVDGIGFKGEPKSFQVLKPLTKAPQSWCYVEV